MEKKLEVDMTKEPITGKEILVKRTDAREAVLKITKEMRKKKNA